MSLPYLASLALFSIGLYCILVKRDLFKVIYGICLMEFSINLFLVSLGFVTGGEVPISPTGTIVVDPLPQAMVLTAIVIEFATTVFLISVAIRLFKQYEDTDISKMRRLRG
ncbi:MAG TPA: cation:proton antiporter [Thermoplasmata archaeon]|nr:cation:proton antiporter [Thermoplasmata archaeon]